jgi:hypothetical protein
VSLENAKDYDNKSFVYRTGTAFRSKNVWPYKRLAAEIEPLKQNGQVLRRSSQTELETGVSAVDAQKFTLERVTPCAA